MTLEGLVVTIGIKLVVVRVGVTMMMGVGHHEDDVVIVSHSQSHSVVVV
jgi:hypothetical protein